MGELINASCGMLRPMVPARTKDEEIARAADIELFAEIAGWATMRQRLAAIQPTVPDARAKALEIRAILRGQPRLTNG
jgi:hypothetical protein